MGRPRCDHTTLCRIRAKQRQLKFERLVSLVYCDSGEWGVVTTTLALHPDDLKWAGPSLKYNPLITAEMHRLQREAHADLDEGRGKAMVVFVMLCLERGGEKLLNCSAGETRSVAILELIKIASNNVRAGKPPSSEMVNLLKEIEEIGCDRPPVPLLKVS